MEGCDDDPAGLARRAGMAIRIEDLDDGFFGLEMPAATFPALIGHGSRFRGGIGAGQRCVPDFTTESGELRRARLAHTDGLPQGWQLDPFPAGVAEDLQQQGWKGADVVGLELADRLDQRADGGAVIQEEARSGGPDHRGGRPPVGDGTEVDALVHHFPAVIPEDGEKAA